MIGAALAWMVCSASPASAEEVRLWHSYRGNEEAALEQVTRAWTEETGIEVVPVAIPFGAFDSKLETAIPRGNGPDLFIAGHGSLGKWSALGIVQPTPADPTGQSTIAVEAMSVDGENYGHPLAFKTLVLFYDPTVIEIPPKTTDELIDAAKQHTGDGSFGLVYETTAAFYHAPWMHAFGARADLPLDDPAHADAFAFSQRLGRTEGIVPQAPTFELMTQLYETGNVTFVISGPWFASDISRPIAATTLPIVSEAGAPARPYLTVEGVLLAGQAREPELAAEFGRFLAGPKGAAIRQEQGKQPITRTDLDPPADPVVAAVIEQSKQAVPLPTFRDLPNVWEALERALRRVNRLATTPTEAAIEARAYHAVLSRGAPPAANPTPYLIVMGLVILGLLTWLGAKFKEASLRNAIRKHRFDYLWVAPAGLGLLILVGLPFVTGAAVSLFAHTNGEWTFVGLRHFTDILLSRDWPIASPLSFFYTLAVTLLWTATNVTLHVAIGVSFALLLREPWVRLKGVWRALLIIPWAVPNYITALIWKTMFHVQYGAINALLTWVLMVDDPIHFNWFGSFSAAFCANLATNTWLGFPFMMVVTLGALQAIPRDLEEAATVDGAGWWFRFRHVVWPLLKPALLPAVILGSVWTFNMFNIIYLVSAGEPDGSTEILISEAYRWAFSRSNRYGYAAAYAVLIFGVLLVYSRGANRLAGKRVL